MLDQRPFLQQCGLTPLKSISHMLGHWLNGINKKDRLLFFVGATAPIWAIQCTRNDLIFEKKQVTSFMQVIFRGAYWLRFSSLLQPKELRVTVRLASKALEVIALDIFAKNSWRSNKRICFQLLPLVGVHFYLLFVINFRAKIVVCGCRGRKLSFL